MSTTTVTSAAELAEALKSGALDIEVKGTITGSPSITLNPGVSLHGGKLEFLAKGVRLTKDNTLRDIEITTADYEAAIYNDTDVEDAGTFTLDNVTTIGQVYIVAEHKVNKIRVEANDVHVAQADVRGRIEQPHGYNVDVLQGGFTLWNRNPNPDSTFSATLRGIRMGTAETPVRGSGLFVAGYADREGKLTGGAFTADVIETGEVHTDGGILPGTPDKITGGVFVVSGAKVEHVINAGPVTTHGQNDMVLDNWGEVEKWEARADIKSTGPSGIGFVNFGDITTLEVNAPIITTGKGSRGFNLYDGRLHSAAFHSIVTKGDGSIGIQVSKPMHSLTVHGDVETFGGEGLSLVRGVQVKLKAIAFSVKAGGHIDSAAVHGALRTHGENVTTFEVAEDGSVDKWHAGSIEALGDDSVTTDIRGSVTEA